ncbi:hypothetical protein ACYX8G_17175 [Microbacterium saperdae]
MLTADEARRLLDLARDAQARGDALLHLQLDVSLLEGQTSSWGSSANAVSSSDTVGSFLSEVEGMGWRLEHTGYAFAETGATSSPRALSNTTGTVTRGQVVGYFTFRRVG